MDSLYCISDDGRVLTKASIEVPLFLSVYYIFYIINQQYSNIGVEGMAALKEDLTRAQACEGPTFNPLLSFYQRADYDTYVSYDNITDVSTQYLHFH